LRVGKNVSLGRLPIVSRAMVSLKRSVESCGIDEPADIVQGHRPRMKSLSATATDTP
jgi:hypothetical protein